MKITSSLPAEAKSHLDSLSTVAATLNAAADPDSIVTATAMEIQTSHTLSRSLMQLQHLQARLESELLSLKSQLNEVRSQAFQPPMALPRQTMEWNRNTKQLRAKLEEYENRLASLDYGNDTASASFIEEVVAAEEEVDRLNEELRSLETRLQAFKGLPKDKNAARKEVQKVEKELSDLQRRRDALFEGLVEKG
jgi:HAUS augmin-like complex subunit 1